MINDKKKMSINNLNKKINNKGNNMNYNEEEKRTYYEAVNNLFENIKIDYI